MSQQGAALQNYNNELVKCIEDLCSKRDELQKQVMGEEEEKHKLQNDLRVLSEKLAKVNESLAKKISARNEFDKTIAETESAYMKVLIANHYQQLNLSLSFFIYFKDSRKLADITQRS